MNSQLATFYKTQKDGSIIYKTQDQSSNSTDIKIEMLNDSFRHIFGLETEEQNEMPPEVLHNNVIRICSGFEF
jgi:hypothetical protein